MCHFNDTEMDLVVLFYLKSTTSVDFPEPDRHVCTDKSVLHLKWNAYWYLGESQNTYVLCCCEAECEEGKAVFTSTASLRITFSKPHPVLFTRSRVSWNSHKMKSTRVCRDDWIKAPNWNPKANIGNLQESKTEFDTPERRPAGTDWQFVKNLLGLWNEHCTLFSRAKLLKHESQH